MSSLLIKSQSRIQSLHTSVKNIKHNLFNNKTGNKQITVTIKPTQNLYPDVMESVPPAMSQSSGYKPRNKQRNQKNICTDD